MPARPRNLQQLWQKKGGAHLTRMNVPFHHADPNPLRISWANPNVCMNACPSKIFTAVRGNLALAISAYCGPADWSDSIRSADAINNEVTVWEQSFDFRLEQELFV